MSDLILGPIIITRMHWRYISPTDYCDPRIVAEHRRDNEETWRRYVGYDNSLSAESNHLAAAQKLLDSWPYVNELRIVGRGHDASAYYFLCSTAAV